MKDILTTPTDAGMYEVESSLCGRPITIKMKDERIDMAAGDSFRMSHEREYVQDGIVVKVRHRTLVEQLFERPCVIRRYGTFQFTDALGHDHAFGGVFFADEDGE